MRTPSSQAWLERQINDPYRRRRQAARLPRPRRLQADRDRRPLPLPAQGCRVIDLGCAPGGWLQVAMERGAGAVAGVDLLPVDPVAGAVILCRTISPIPACGERLIEAIGGAAGPDPLGHGAQHHRPSPDRPPAHRRPDRGGGGVRGGDAEARRRLRRQGLPGRRDRGGAEDAEGATSARCVTSSPRPAGPKARRSISSPPDFAVAPETAGLDRRGGAPGANRDGSPRSALLRDGIEFRAWRAGRP